MNTDTEDEGALNIAKISKEAVPRIKTAERQISVLLEDLVVRQGLDVRAVAIALGRVIVSYKDPGILARIFLGSYWTLRTLEEAAKEKPQVQLYMHPEGQWLTIRDSDES